MFSDMDKVTQKIPSPATPRAGKIDTREEIRRHDPDQERKKGAHKGFAKEQGLFGDDQTEVSVASLDAFLPMLLKNYSAQDIEEREVAFEKEPVDPTSPNAVAAGAYARMSKYSPMKNLKEKAQKAKEEHQKSENPTLSKEEVQTIYRLQADVVKLRQKGVETIYINKAGTFLKSLQNAIEDALQIKP